MKNRFLVSMVSALFVVGLMASCDLFDKADDISFSTEFEKSFVVQATGSYAQTITLDATTDPEVEKYKEKINGIEINKLTYTISNYVGPVDETFTGNMVFDTNPQGSVSVSGVNLSQASTSGDEMALDLSQDEINALANELKDNKTVDVTMSGSFDEGIEPVSFVLTVKVDAKITADAL